MQERRLGKTDVTLTSLGLGTSPLGGCNVDVSFQTFEAVVLKAYELGVRYFDTAPLYGLGKSEHSLGHVLRNNDLVGKVVVSTKAGRILKPESRARRAESLYGIDWVKSLPFVDEYDYSYDGIMRAFEDSQQRLGMDHIDILYLHDVSGEWHREAYDTHLTALRTSGYKACDELRRAGSVKAIGLGVNETASVLQVAEEFDLDCSMVAGRYTLLNHGALDHFYPEMQRRGIGIVAAGIYNSGILAEGSKSRTTTRTYDCQPAPEPIVRKVEALEAVCERHGVSLPTAATQFVYAHPAVTAVVQGALTPEHVAANIAAISTPVPAAFWDDLKSSGLIPAAAPVPGA
ncbi:aldo/keto reductase [Mesorhizobium sp.]|uniref:aldo/keto reductase n=1 Tax=Mesorhizobium sp. TaxID=1871066 RepID=UPI000FE98AAD|nr:aldo/keto reductase [Mesorhizobium sp.]RWG04139.1 MAG: aldo/keto reductase [Mesorhizobium sp.]RWH01136.1 MAG: aldo/keto reductase [Mesorhizobium sp.]TIN49379.1 MAG: aldo/keto reductase [Mesorhizobium sp.]TIR94990.1 MAG: aldo/keto reductase [Mesorhizobium sp.]TIS04665.1 MAG: aldo/keto reductase [Mesorhizobium sp.]